MIDVAFEECKFHILSTGDGIRFVKKRTTGAAGLILFIFSSCQTWFR